MVPTMYRIILAGVFMALALASAARAAESADKGEGAKQSSIEALVANQPAKPTAMSSDTASDKPMTINFSDFVKDGAGCGVPNLETSSK
jgi:hypothetical protein